MDFIANGDGDMVVRQAVRRTANCMVSVLRMSRWNFPDYDNLELEANLLLDTLHSDAPDCPRRITTAFSIPFSKIMPTSP